MSRINTSDVNKTTILYKIHKSDSPLSYMVNTALYCIASSALTLLVGRQGWHLPCKKAEGWGAGVVIYLEQGADLHIAQPMPLPLTVSCFGKIQIGFTFLVRLTRVVPDKGPLTGCVCIVLPQQQQQQQQQQLTGSVRGHRRTRSTGLTDFERGPYNDGGTVTRVRVETDRAGRATGNWNQQQAIDVIKRSSYIE